MSGISLYKVRGEFTVRQWEYLIAIDLFYKANDQFPPCVILAEAVGGTNNAAAEMYARLADYGVVRLNSVGKYMRGEKWPF